MKNTGKDKKDAEKGRTEENKRPEIRQEDGKKGQERKKDEEERLMVLAEKNIGKDLEIKEKRAIPPEKIFENDAALERVIKGPHVLDQVRITYGRIITCQKKAWAEKSDIGRDQKKSGQFKNDSFFKD